MAVEQEIAERLEAVAGVTNLAGTRIYYGPPPQGPTYPLVSFWRVSAEPRSQSMGTSDGIVYARYQFDCRSDVTLREARELAEQVRAALDRWSDSGGTPEVLDTYLEDDADEPAPAGVEPRVFTARVEAQVVYRE